MEKTQKLIIDAVEWTAEAGEFLADACLIASVEDYQAQVETGKAALFRISDEAGAALCFYILRIDEYAHKRIGVIVAATSRAKFSLVDCMMSSIEKQFIGVDEIQQFCTRAGMVKKMVAQGWEATHIVISKKVNHG
jgi:hypothetical protein